MSENNVPRKKHYHSATTKKLDKSRLEISGTIPAEVWSKYRVQALKNVNESLTVDGFRKGMIPENVLISKVGEMAVLEEMAELALSPAYLEIMVDNKIDAIGRPHVQVTKLAANNPLEFKAVTAVVPEVTLPDYKKLAQNEIKKRNPDHEKYTEQELEDTIRRVISATSQTKAPSNDPGGHSVDREKVGIMLGEQKREEAKEKTRIRIADAIDASSNIDIPDVLVDSELARIEAQFKTDIEKMGVKLEDYMKHAKKNLDEIRKEWRPHAEKKARLQLILNAIAQKENIAPDAKDVEAEVKHILDHYKDADGEKARAFAETVLTNEKVFQFLEKSV